MSNSKSVSEMSKDEKEELFASLSFKVRINLDYLASLSMFLELGIHEEIINMNVELAKILRLGD